MNKSEFVSYMSEKNNCTKAEAERTIDMFTKSAMKALSANDEISLVGFGNFVVTKVPAREGRNPQTGAVVKISARNQVKFKPGKTLKDACNA